MKHGKRSKHSAVWLFYASPWSLERVLWSLAEQNYLVTGNGLDFSQDFIPMFQV